MVVKLSPQRVSRQVAMNPIARAVAKQKLLKSMVDVKIKLYMTEEGEAIQHILQEISRLVVVTLLACKIDEVDEHLEVMDQALRKLCEMSETGFKWRKDDSSIVDDAMDAVILVTPKLSPLAIQQATIEIARLEEQERRNGTTYPAAA